MSHYEDVLRTLHWDVLWDVIFQRPKDVVRGRPQGDGRRCPLALHRGPYKDFHRTSFGDVLRTSSGRNFTECERAKIKHDILLKTYSKGATDLILNWQVGAQQLPGSSRTACHDSKSFVTCSKHFRCSIFLDFSETCRD